MYTKKFAQSSKVLIIFGLMMFFSADLLAQEQKKYPEKPKLVICYCIDTEGKGGDFELDTVTLDVEKCREARACSTQGIPGGMEGKEIFRFVDQGRIYEVLEGQIKFVGNTSQ